MTGHNQPDIDEKIRAALGKLPDAQLPGPFEEAGMFEQFRSTFRGRNRWISWIVFVCTFVFFVAGVTCAVYFFRVEPIEHKMALVGGFLYCMMAVAMFKMWQWMQMDKIVILREIKRLELQVAHLASKMPTRTDPDPN